jgi:hypothetical protein
VVTGDHESRRTVIVYRCLIVAMSVVAAAVSDHARLGGDEANLIALAWRANEMGFPARHGLVGTQDFTYGPVVVHLHQLSLLLSESVRFMAANHAATFVLLGGFAFLSLLRALRLSMHFAWLFLSSPFLWIYGAGLWDNPWTVPLGLAMLAAGVIFFRGRTGLSLMLTMWFAQLACMTHLMAVPLAASVAVALLASRGSAIGKQWRWVVGGLLFGAAYGSGYVAHLSGWDTTLPATPTGEATTLASPRGWAVPVEPDWLDPVDLPAWVGSSARAIAHPIMTLDTDRPTLFRLATFMSLLIHAAFALGMATLLRKPAGGVAVARRWVLWVGGLSLVLLAGVALFGRMRGHVHYQFGVMPVVLVTTAIGLQSIRPGALRVGACVVLLLGMAIQSAVVHQTLRHRGQITLQAQTIHTLESLRRAADRIRPVRMRTVRTNVQSFAESPILLLLFERRDGRPVNQGKISNLWLDGFFQWEIDDRPDPAGGVFVIDVDAVRNSVGRGDESTRNP